MDADADTAVAVCSDEEDTKEGDIEEGHNNNNKNSNDKTKMSMMTFEQSLLSHHQLFDGLRGLCSLMVFYGHFGRYYPLGIYRKVDTLLFIILSRLTTHLQYHNINSNKSRWSAFSFLYYKFLALFPIFWVAVLLSIPLYINYSHRYHLAHHTLAKLLITRILGIDMWFTWADNVIGSLWYTALIWNIFLLYAGYVSLMTWRLEIKNNSAIVTALLLLS